MATNYNYFGNLVTSGLVLDLDAAKVASYPGTGTTWYDISGNNYSGSLTNGPTFTGIGKSASIVFDGSDDIAIMNSGSYYIKNNGEPITVNTWIKPGRLGGQYQDIIANRLNTEYNWILYQHASSGSLGFHGANQNQSTYIPVTGSWINTTVTVTPSRISTLYVNGSPYQTVSNFEYGPNTQNRLSIGNGAYQSSFEPYLGSVSVAQIYNRAISQFEVWQNFNAFKGRYGIPDIVTNGLILNLDAGNPYSYLSGSSGTTWTNTVAVSSSISGTLVNGPVYANGAISFDGTNDYTIGNGVFVTTEATSIVWFRTSNTYGNNYLLSLPWVSAGSNGFDLGFGGSTTFRGIIVTTSGLKELNYTTTYSDNKWHMVAMTYSASNAVLYYDGVARTTDTSLSGSLRQTANGEFNLARFGSFGAYAAANISSTQVYNRALSATEITQNFNALRGRYGI